MDLIAAASQEIYEAISQEYTEHFSVQAAKRVIEDAFRSFFQKNIKPFAAFPRDDRPAIDLLISINSERQTFLLKASGSTVREVNAEAACIGSGAILAESLIEKFYSPFMNIDDIVIAAAYIMHQVETYDINCGGPTDLYVASPKYKFFGRIPPVAMSELEATFGHVDSTTSALLGFANCNIDDDGVKRRLEITQKDMLNLRHKLASGESYLYPLLARLSRKPAPSGPAESSKN